MIRIGFALIIARVLLTVGASPGRAVAAALFITSSSCMIGLLVSSTLAFNLLALAVILSGNDGSIAP